MLDALQHGRADLLIGALRESPPADVVQEHLFDDPLAVIARVGHPLARAFKARRRRPLLALARYPWIAPRLARRCGDTSTSSRVRRRPGASPSRSSAIRSLPHAGCC